MSESATRFRRNALMVLVLGISVLFLLVIGRFLMPLFLGAIFTGLVYPLFQRLERGFGGRPTLAAVATLGLTLLVIIIPLSFFAGIVIEQAVDVSVSGERYLEEQLTSDHPFASVIERFPILERLRPYQDLALARVGEITGVLGSFVVNLMSAAGRGTLAFLLSLFVMLYAMYFFLKDGPRILDRILYLLPLPQASESRLVERFTSVTRATVKGTLVIGLVQGGLAGLGLLIAGVPGVALWTTVMVVLSIIPAVGTALVWIPATIYLGIEGRMVAAAALAVWCAVVVGSADNVLRPALVGRDTEMSDLLVLVSTMGGLLVFGAPGVVVGPIVAALFLTVWDLYALEFKGLLPETGSHLQ